MKEQAIKSVSIVGGGNVATHLVRALMHNRLPLKQVFVRNLQKYHRLKEEFGVELINDPLNLLPVDLIILAVTDDSLAEVAQGIDAGEAILAHVSGTMPLSLLRNYTEHYAVFYPLQTFSQAHQVNFQEVPLFLQAAQEEDLKQLHYFALQLSNTVVLANDDMRRNLHLAAIFASNFSNALYGIADELLTKQGLSFDYLKPLIMETAAKACMLDPIKGQTGPARRNDQSVIEMHRGLLTNEKEMLGVYNRLTDYILTKYHTFRNE